jgi:hypothetical protein
LATFVGRSVDEGGDEAIPEQADLGIPVSGFGIAVLCIRFGGGSSGHGTAPERIWTSVLRILRSGVAAQSAKRVGLNQASEPLARPPVPEEAQPIGEAVGDHFRPAGLGPGEEVERGLEQGTRGLARPGVFAERIEQGRTGIVLGQSLEERTQPGGGLGGERAAPTAHGARCRRSFHSTTPRDPSPGGSVFKSRDDHQLNHLEEVVAKAQQETRQQREGLVARFAVPALDEHPVDLRGTEGLADVEPMGDEEPEGVAVGADLGTGKHQLSKMIHILVDRAAKLGYNHHRLQPDPKHAAKQSLRVGLFLSPG